MASLLPPQSPVKITQSTKAPTLKQCETVDHLIVLLPEKATAKDWNSVPKGKRLKTLARRRHRDGTPLILSRLDNKAQTGIHLALFPVGASRFKSMSLARKLAASALAENPARVAILAAGFDAEGAENLIGIQVLALLLATLRLPTYRSRNDNAPRLSKIRLLGLSERLDLARIEAEAEGNNLARWLTAMPPNVLDARGLRAAAGELAERHGWQYEFLGLEALRERGAGAFLAVASGNDSDDAGIIRLTYRAQGEKDPSRLALVGKGIIFDTGGTNLKPASGMLDMHGDMQGSAVALGTLLALSRLQVPLEVDCWLAVSENRTGPRAYKQQDLITAANGKTIQVIHTDAEGRMVLADALTLAGEKAPRLIVDYATLTGACVSAITTRYSGIFTNRPALEPVLRSAGDRSGERVWPFPVTDEFREDLKSEVADIQQCRASGGGDHIMAAVFLREFVPDDTDWIHIDLSASNHEGGLGPVPSKVTGFGVRYTLALLLDEADGPLQSAG